MTIEYTARCIRTKHRLTLQSPFVTKVARYETIHGKVTNERKCIALTSGVTVTLDDHHNKSQGFEQRSSRMIYLENGNSGKEIIKDLRETDHETATFSKEIYIKVKYRK